MTELNSLTQDELAALLSELGEPKFRAKQLFQWLHQYHPLSIYRWGSLQDFEQWER